MCVAVHPDSLTGKGEEREERERGREGEEERERERERGKGKGEKEKKEGEGARPVHHPTPVSGVTLSTGKPPGGGGAGTGREDVRLHLEEALESPRRRPTYRTGTLSAAGQPAKAAYHPSDPTGTGGCYTTPPYTLRTCV